MDLPVVEQIHRAKYTVQGEDTAPFEQMLKDVDEQIDGLLARSREAEHAA
jgi:hypothetical protein